MCRISKWLGVCITLLLPTISYASFEVHAELDRTPIFLDETVNLIVTSEGTRQFSEKPNVDHLRKDFEIISESVQTSINIVNNVTNIVHRWIYEIKPLRLGITTVPPIKIGEKQTEPIALEVNEYLGNVLTEGSDIFLEVDVAPKSPYVQSQAILSIQLFVSNQVSVPEGTISNPELEFGPFEKLGQDHRYQAKRAGINYRVIQKKFAIFPEKSGEIQIAPIEFNGVVARRNLTTNQLDYTRERISSSPISLNVRPQPASFSGSIWLPARDLQLQDSWSGRTPDFETSTPETRTIKIEAVGLRAVQLIEPNYQTNDTVRIYSNTPQLKSQQNAQSVVGQRTDEFVIIPQSENRITVPEFKVVWWDVVEDREKVSVLPEITWVSSAQSDQADLNLIELTNQDEQFLLNQIQVPTENWWKWFGLGIFSLWLITVFAWLLQSRQNYGQSRVTAQESEQQAVKERQVINQLRAACKQGDPSAASNLLLGWAKNQWRNFPPTNLIELSDRLQNEKITAEIRALDQTLFSADEEQWDGNRLWLLLDDAIRRRKRKHKVKSKFAYLKKSSLQLAELWPDGQIKSS